MTASDVRNASKIRTPNAVRAKDSTLSVSGSNLDESVPREFAEELGAAIDARSTHAVALVY